MGWSVGFDSQWNRDIGYGVPSWCDEPGCDIVIDRGLAFVCCNSEPYGGDTGCGLFFCSKHRKEKIRKDVIVCGHKGEYKAKPDHPDWIKYKLKDKSWKQWRLENPKEVKKMKEILNGKF